MARALAHGRGIEVTAHEIAGLRVLVVEDDTLVALLEEEYLTDLGCVVVGCVSNVADGVAKVSDPTLELDCALLDINLQGERVFPVAEALLDRGVPFLFATGYGAAGLPPRFAGFPVLAKPFRLKALEVAISVALSLVQGGLS